MIPCALTAPTVLLTLVLPALAQLPYNPPNFVLSSGSTWLYEFSTQRSALSIYDISVSLASSATPSLDVNLPSQPSTDQAYVPIADGEGLSIFSGNCQDDTVTPQLWRFTPTSNHQNGVWKNLQISSSDSSLDAQYLAAGFSFASTAGTNDTDLYVFGGMCPDTTSTLNSTNWASQATYTNNLLSLTPNDVPPMYQLSGASSPPIAEAGLTITPMPATLTTSSSGQVTQQQNFVFLGGHTQTAFINMSQVALFSLPQGAWAFVGVDQPSSAQGELVKRDDTIVEPRSGHTAVLSEDGTKVYVFGGWVGDVTNPATPQMAILEIGEGFGGSGTWAWTVPSQANNPFSTGQGIYGHGAVMLPGNVMMVGGGTSIGKSTSKRSTGQNFMFYNTTSGSWAASYTNPAAVSSASHSSSGLSTSQKAGLGAGLGIGLAVIIGIAIFWFLYARRLRNKRLDRERRLREQALGTGSRYQSEPYLPCGIDGRGGLSEMRSASWGSAQEKRVQGRGDAFPWAPVVSQKQAETLNMEEADETYEAERSGLDFSIPSPTRGLRRSLHSRGATGFGNNFNVGPAGSVFRIDEEEEGSVRSQGVQSPVSRLSDPFKDPPKVEPKDKAAEGRKKEVQGWIEDWQSAAESLNISRNPSQSRTYSNLSQAHSRTYSNLSNANSQSQSNSDRTGRTSPEKSDRTGSNLSERSAISARSIPRMSNGMTRTLSQRSVSAGYALFASAAAAMSKLGAGNNGQIERSASKRSVSMHGTSSRPAQPSAYEGHALLRDESPIRPEPAGYWTPPESPIKDYKSYVRTSSMTSQGRSRARSLIGSVKRKFTGTSQVDVQATVEDYEHIDKDAKAAPEMIETDLTRKTSNPAVPFWRGKKGARDWEENPTPAAVSSTAHKRHSGQTRDEFHGEEYEGEEWDVETAVQQRVVQVMFTVPKEKLRVVNADALSLISRSDAGETREERDAEIKRMSSVKEGEDEEDAMKDLDKGKGKNVELHGKHADIGAAI